MLQLLSFEPNTVLHRSKIRFIEERSRDAKKQGGKRRGKEGAKGGWGGSFATAMHGQPPPVPLAPFTWKNLKGRFFTLGGREININERKTTVVLCTVVCRNERERGEMCPSQGRGKARAAIIASRLQRFPPSGYGYGV